MSPPSSRVLRPSRRSLMSAGCVCSRPARRARQAVAASRRCARTTGVARSTIGRGLRDLRGGGPSGGRVRRAGGGRKAAVERPGLLEALAELIRRRFAAIRKRRCCG